MIKNYQRGTIFRCPVCMAEITIIASISGDSFNPHCCNTSMEELEYRAGFYRCLICGSEVASVNKTCGDFRPVCCNELMSGQY